MSVTAGTPGDESASKAPGCSSDEEMKALAAFYRANGYPKFVEELLQYCLDQKIKAPGHLLAAIRGPTSEGPVEYSPTQGRDGLLDRQVQTRVMVISSNLSMEMVLARAVHSAVGLVLYDAKHTDLKSLLGRIAAATRGVPADSIAIIDHGAPGVFHLLEGVEVNAAGLADEKGDLATFFVSIGKLIKPSGRLDLLACNLLSNESGAALVKRIEQLTSRAVAASTDVTGAGGNFVLERGQVDVAAQYFDIMQLSAWQSSAGFRPRPVTLSPDVEIQAGSRHEVDLPRPQNPTLFGFQQVSVNV